MQHRRGILFVATTSLCVDGLTAVLINTSKIAIESFTVGFALGEECKSTIIQELKDIGSVYEMPARKLSPIRYYFALRKLIRDKAYQIVYIHGNSATMILDLLAAYRGGALVRITHCHNQAEQPWLKKAILGKLMNRLVTIPVACSQEAGKALYTKPFKVIRNGIDTERFRFSENARNRIRDEYGLQESFVIGHIGRFSKQKNHKKLVSVFSQVVKMQPKAMLVLCGTGELLPEVKEQVCSLGLREQVIFCGNVDQPEEFFSAMDVFVLPSLFEGLPLVGLEAQASGLPCVFSDSITEEAAISGEVEFLSLQDEDQMWAEKICSLTGKDRVSAAGRVRAAGYGSDKMQEQIKTLYSDIRGEISGSCGSPVNI